MSELSETQLGADRNCKLSEKVHARVYLTQAQFQLIVPKSLMDNIQDALARN